MQINSIIIVKNSNSVAVPINDLGVSVPANGELDLSVLYSMDDVVDSDDLKKLVENEILVINDGVQDLEVDDSYEHLVLPTVWSALPISVQKNGTEVSDRIRTINLTGTAIDDITFDSTSKVATVETTSIQENTGDRDVILSFANNVDSHINISSTSWMTITAIIFRGSNILRSPISVNIIASVDKTNSRGNFRIYDVTNSQTITEILNFNNTDDVIHTTTTISNVPAEQSIWELQASTNTSNAKLSISNFLLAY